MAVKVSPYHFQLTCRTGCVRQISNDLMNVQRRERYHCSRLTLGFWRNWLNSPQKVHFSFNSLNVTLKESYYAILSY